MTVNLENGEIVEPVDGGGEQSLAVYDGIKAALEQARSLDELLRVRNRAEFWRSLAKKAGAGLEIQNRGAEMKIRAERRLGEVVPVPVRGNPNGRAVGQMYHDDTFAPSADCYADLGLTRLQASRWREEASVPEERFEQWLRWTKDEGEEVTTAGLLKLARRPQLDLQFSTRSDEWNTPPEVLDAVARVLGGIDLDPCSNSTDTPNVPAERVFTEEDDGLAQVWTGRVYMNPPYGRVIGAWVQKLVDEYEAGNVTEAITLVPARTDTEWFELLVTCPFCLVKGRLKFGDADNSAPFPSAIAYFGPRPERFAHVFRHLGHIVRRWEVA